MDKFIEQLLTFPQGTSEGFFGDRRYSVSVFSSVDGKRHKLYAEELGGNDHISFNLYFLKSGSPLLKPCEMPQKKVIDFVLGYRPDTQN